MRMKWLGTAGLLLEQNGYVIAFDPFGGLYPDKMGKHRDLSALKEQCKDVQAVFVTHGHVDHIFDIPALFGQSAIPIYCTSAPAATLESHGMPSACIHTIQSGSVLSCGPFHIQALASRHCHFDAPLIVQTALSSSMWHHAAHGLHLLSFLPRYPEHHEILFYEIACQNCRVQVLGSMNLDPSVQYPRQADLLVLPLQGRSDQDEYALSLVQTLQPKAIVLDHYDNSFPPLTKPVCVQGFLDNVNRQFHIPCQPLQSGKWLTVVPDTLSDGLPDRKKESIALKAQSSAMPADSRNNRARLASARAEAMAQRS